MGRPTRRSPRRQAPSPADVAEDILHCAFCGSDLVSPMVWRQVGARGWWIRTRCGECGWFRDVTVDQRVAECYDRALDRGADVIEQALVRADRARFIAEGSAFLAALSSGLLSPRDFRRDED